MLWKNTVFKPLCRPGHYGVFEIFLNLNEISRSDLNCVCCVIPYAGQFQVRLAFIILLAAIDQDDREVVIDVASRLLRQQKTRPDVATAQRLFAERGKAQHHPLVCDGRTNSAFPSSVARPRMRATETWPATLGFSLARRTRRKCVVFTKFTQKVTEEWFLECKGLNNLDLRIFVQLALNHFPWMETNFAWTAFLKTLGISRKDLILPWNYFLWSLTVTST